MICLQCSGDGGWERAWGYSSLDGRVLSDWVTCRHCGGVGALDAGCDDAPTLDDVLDEDAAIAASEG